MMMCSCCGFRKVRKGLWSPDEDEKLRDYVSKHGTKGWGQVPLQAGLERCGKSCRLRWLNYLRPGIKRGEFSPEELQLIFELQAMYGNRWSWIAQWLPGRTDNEIKNFWNVHMNPKKCKQAINFEQVSSYRLAVPFKLEAVYGVPEIQKEDPVLLQQNSIYATDSGPHFMDNSVLDDMILECMKQNNLFMQPDNSFPCMDESMQCTVNHCADSGAAS